MLQIPAILTIIYIMVTITVNTDIYKHKPKEYRYLNTVPASSII